MQTKFLDNNGLLYVWKKIKESFVKKEELTKALEKVPKKVTDLSDAANYAQVSSVPTKVENLTDASEYAKKTDIVTNVENLQGIDAYAKTSALPTKVEQLEDAANYVKKTDLTEEVKHLVGNIQSIDFKVVDSLPQTGDKATIYLISDNKGENDAYDEYIYVNDRFEKIGTTSVDLSGYVKKEDVKSISNEEIDALFV